MNPVDRFMTYGAAIFATVIMLVYGSWADDDTAMAQAVADDRQDAIQMARDKAECRNRYGDSVDMFLLDGQHLVCRAAVKTAGVKK